MAYRVLIIGCGAIAGGYDKDRSPDDWPLSHAGAITRDDRFELAACVDPDEAAREAFAERWNVPVSAPCLDTLAAAPGDFDLIVIASPTNHHADQLEWALEMRPRAVFCEKPLAKNIATVEALIGAYETARIPLIVNYTRRWAPDLRGLADSAARGEWGALLSAVGTYGKGVVHNGTHMVDLLEMFVGPMEVRAIGQAVIDFWDDDPTVDAILTAREWNEPVHLVSSDARALTQFELVLNYERGEIAMRDGGMRIETRRVVDSETFAGYRQLGPVEAAPGRYVEAMRAAYDDLAGVIGGTGQPKPAPSNGFATHAICEELRLAGLQQVEDQ